VNKEIISQSPKFGPGHLHSGGGLHTKLYEGTCRCGKVFRTTAPRQKHCSMECARAASDARVKARKARKGPKR
jgi:hypothetical protein